MQTHRRTSRSKLPILAALIGVCAAPVATHAEQSYRAWKQFYNESPNIGDFAVATAMDRRGNVIVTGYIGDAGSRDIYTAKFDAIDGHMVWERTYFHTFGDNRPTSVAVDGNGNVFVAGSATNNSGNLDFLLIKYNADGTDGWTKITDGPQNGLDRALKVIVDGSSNVIAVGESYGQISGNSTQEDFYTVKYTNAGAFVWSNRYNGALNSTDRPTGVAIDTNGNVVVTGRSRLSTGDDETYTIKYNGQSGGKVWDAHLPTTNYDMRPTGVAFDSAGDVIVTGTKSGGGNFRFFTQKYDANPVINTTTASPIWFREISSTALKIKDSVGGIDFVGSVGLVVDSADNVVVAGSAAGNQATVYFLRKYDVNGVTLWDAISDAPGDSDTAVAVGIDGADNIVVTGIGENEKLDEDYYTVKFGPDGSQLWSHRFDGPEYSDPSKNGGRPDKPTALAVDDLGNVVVTGQSINPDKTSYFGMLTLKYNRLFAVTGDPISGQFLPANAKIAALNVPAVSDNAGIAAKSTIAAGKAKIQAILAEGVAAGSLIAAQQGVMPPDAPNANCKYKAFSDPVLASNGTIAFQATMTGLPAVQATGIWTNGLNANHDMQLVLQTGTPVPNAPVPANKPTPVPLLKGVTSMSLRTNRLFALLRMSGAYPTMLFTTTAKGDGKVLLHVGQKLTIGNLPETTVKAITILNPAVGTPGYQRWVNDNSVIAKVLLADKRTALLQVTSLGIVTPILTSGDSFASTTWKTFGMPATSSFIAINHAVLGTLAPNKAAGVTALNDTAIVYNFNTSAFTVTAREGELAWDANGNQPMGGPTYAGFFDPMVNLFGNVAFVGTLKGPGVTAANKTGLWYGANTNPKLVARTGFPTLDAGGAPTSLLLGGIVSTALPSISGPIFVGTLKGPGVTAKNNVALFASDSKNQIRRLLRTGDVIRGENPDGTPIDRTIKSITLLNALPGSFGTARSYNNTNDIAALILFTNKQQAIIPIGIP